MAKIYGNRDYSFSVEEYDATCDRKPRMIVKASHNAGSVSLELNLSMRDRDLLIAALSVGDPEGRAGFRKKRSRHPGAR